MDAPPIFNEVSLPHLPCVRAAAGCQATTRVVRRRSAPRTLIDPGKVKHVAEKGAVGLGVTGINDRVHPCDHRSPSIELCRERMMFMSNFPGALDLPKPNCQARRVVLSQLFCRPAL